MDLAHLILASNDIKLEAVEVPEWEATVFVKTLTAGERTRVHGWAEKNLPDFDARLLVLVARTDDGKPLFHESHIPALMDKSATAIQRVVKAALALNGFGGGAVEKKESI